MEEISKAQETLQPKEKKEIKLEYIPFVVISSIIGLVLAYLLFNKVLNLSNVLSGVFSILCVGVYVSICLSLKKYLEKWILSEIFLYLFFGFLTTAVNIIAFNVLTVTFRVSISDTSIAWKAAEGIAFVIAVLFAYITNKLFVFKSVCFDFKTLGREIVGFFGARIISEIVVFIIMWVLIDKFNKAELFAKIVSSVVNIVLNYIASKFIIFKKNLNE